jgi:hemerythrin-like domain-containing protein
MPDASKFSPKTIPLSPTEILRAEHRQIDEQLNVLSGALRQLGDRGPAPEVLDRIESVARYIDSEMAIHHQKEEDCLFPFLKEFFTPENLRIDARIADHEDLNIMNSKFKQSLNECRDLESGKGATFAAQMLRGYGLYIVHLIREHLLKEDHILFLVAEEYLTADQEAEILERFAAIEGGGIQNP